MTNDQFYRYKMEKLVAKVEGTGNGIKTVLVNVSAIARSLERPPSYITKFFGHELGAQTQMYPRDDRYIVNGAHDCEKLQNSLDVFIRKFVLCPKCDNPETKLSVRQSNDSEIRQVCIACGNKSIIKATAHKVAGFIIKNPPETDSKAKSGTGDSKTTKKVKDSSKTSGSNRNGENHDEKSKENNGASKSTDEDDDEDWGEEEDLKKNHQELDAQIKGMIQTDDLEKSVDERCDKLRTFIQERQNDDKLKDAATIKDILAEAQRLEITEEAPFTAGLTLFTENILKEVDDYKLLFRKLCEKNAKGQSHLLNAVENVLFRHESLQQKYLNPKSMARLLMKFYDHEIIDEDNFHAWYKKPMKRFSSKDFSKKIREASTSFIEWLETAEESSDSEDDEENGASLEPEIDFTPTAINGLEVRVETTRTAPVTEKIEYDGETIDVDNI